MPPSIQVCPVEIPGRGRRDGEASINDIADLAHLLARSLPLQVVSTNLLVRGRHILRVLH